MNDSLLSKSAANNRACGYFLGTRGASAASAAVPACHSAGVSVSLLSVSSAAKRAFEPATHSPRVSLTYVKGIHPKNSPTEFYPMHEAAST